MAKDSNSNNKQTASEHVRAEIESLRAMLHEWFGNVNKKGREEPSSNDQSQKTNTNEDPDS